ncbi:hypothetical protein CVU37_00330 [candidate division BRC1 bacterium HGW-BRC1-1]|nr:MAG: hypothetical protein CVU37_00330 [candidate division BRC1 bacterium HGW-BRC1-1]
MGFFVSFFSRFTQAGMARNAALTAFGAMLGCSAGPITAAPLPPVKVGCYNIHSCIGTDDVRDYDRIATVIRSAAPDVVGLNEVRRFIFGDKQDEEIAARLGPDYTHVFGHLRYPDPITAYGNSIVTRLEVVSSQTYLFSKTAGLEQRGLLRATLRKDGQLIHFFVTHMTLDATEHPVHTQEILDIMAGFPTGTRILAGDMNARSWWPSIINVTATYDDAAAVYGIGEYDTFALLTSPKRIDFIFLDHPLAATSVQVPRNPLSMVASDHLPVFASIVDPNYAYPVVTQLLGGIDGEVQLAAMDITTNTANAFTQGAPVVVTDGDASSCEATFDDLQVRRMMPAWQEGMESTSIGSPPTDWKQLYVSTGGTALGLTIQIGGKRMWHQKSSNYAKYHFAPAVYPDWRDYEFRARVKTLSFGNGLWRMNIMNYPDTNTAYNTYKLEVRQLVNTAPEARLMKGGTELAKVTLADVDVDPLDWNLFAVRCIRRPSTAGQVTNELSIWANGKRILSARDTVPDAPGAYTQGSVVLVTVGGTDGDCDILADDFELRRLETAWTEDFNAASPSPDWKELYVSPSTAASAAISGGVWSQRSEQYMKYHFAPTPYPDWRDYYFSGKVRAVDLGGGKWRMNTYNFPATDTAYETYKLEVRQATGGPEMRLMRGGQALDAKMFSALPADAMQWHDYELGVFTHDLTPRIIRVTPAAVVDDWQVY